MLLVTPLVRSLKLGAGLELLRAPDGGPDFAGKLTLSLAYRLFSPLSLGISYAHLFANRRANRMKVLVHDGIGVWLAARRLNAGKFAWPRDVIGTMPLTRQQLDALVLGLPWQRIGEAGIIRVL